MLIGLNQFLIFVISNYMECIYNLSPVFELGMAVKFFYGVVKFIEQKGSISLACSEEDLISEMLPDKRVLVLK